MLKDLDLPSCTSFAEESEGAAAGHAASCSPTALPMMQKEGLM
jgi:hypothetical protein